MIEIRLEGLLKKKGRSFYWLAKQTGISHPTVSKLRHQRAIALRLDVLERLCDALDCEPGDLLVRLKRKKRKGRKGG